MLEIFVKKKRVIVNLILSVAWILLCLLALMTSDRRLNWINVFYLVLGIFYFLQYYYQNNKPFIRITDGAIMTYSFFKSKTILIKDIESIKSVFGDFIIRSDKHKVTISKDTMDKASYTLLENRLKEIQTQRGD